MRARILCPVLFGDCRLDCTCYRLAVLIVSHEVHHLTYFVGPFLHRPKLSATLKGRGDEDYLIVAMKMRDKIAHMPQPVSVSNGNTTKLHYQARHLKNRTRAIFASI